MKQTFLFSATLLLCSSFSLLGGTANSLDPRCQSGSLQSYLNLNNQEGVQGCSIGFLNFDRFSFVAGQGSPDGATDITVDPALNGFSFSDLSGTFTGPAHYQIGYHFTIDPAPIVDGADLSLDPPFGNVSVIQYYCLDSDFQAGTNGNGGTLVTCSGRTGPQTLQVTVGRPFDSKTFNPPAFSGGSVLTDIQIGSSSGFEKVTGDAHVTGTPDSPEPVTSCLAFLGLCAMVVRKKVKSLG